MWIYDISFRDGQSIRLIARQIALYRTSNILPFSRCKQTSNCYSRQQHFLRIQLNTAEYLISGHPDGYQILGPMYTSQYSTEPNILLVIWSSTNQLTARQIFLVKDIDSNVRRTSTFERLIRYLALDLRQHKSFDRYDLIWYLSLWGYI